MNPSPEMKNRSAHYNFSIIESFVAGVVLVGTEVKSLRQGKASFNDAFCAFDGNELFLRNLHIPEYEYGTANNHEAVRERKLLLNRQELKKMLKRTKEKGHTIVPLRIFFSESGYVKIEIALAKGKKTYDKRDGIKKRDMDRELKRSMKY